MRVPFQSNPDLCFRHYCGGQKGGMLNEPEQAIPFINTRTKELVTDSSGITKVVSKRKKWRSRTVKRKVRRKVKKQRGGKKRQAGGRVQKVRRIVRRRQIGRGGRKKKKCCPKKRDIF